MEILVTREMINEAISNVNEKLSSGKQKERVYAPGAKKDTYYMNNIIGELGELVFKKAILAEGYELGLDLKEFGTFMNSDVGDFMTSKTAQSIDTKTVIRENNKNLIISKSLVDWRLSSHYVLVGLLPTVKKEVSINSIYDITHGVIHGFINFRDLISESNKRVMYGKEVYFVNQGQLSPISNLFENNFFKKDEKVQKYYSDSKIEFHIASVDKGSINNDEDVNFLSDKYNKKERGDGHYNFKNVYLRDKQKIVSFSIYKDKINVALFAKALLSAEAQARETKSTLVIPDYIEQQLSQEDKLKIVKLIRGMKCNLEFAWSTECY